MQMLYWLGISVYALGIRVSALFNRKAARWTAGRRGLLRRIEREMKPVRERRFWFHCASLGEFELGKPLMEAIRKGYPGSRVVLTFFSPSGYDAAKNTPLADHVFFLPTDSPHHARRFVRAVSPAIAFFVKHDFWHFYIRELRHREIPVYALSARFHAGQVYFRWFGGFFRKILRRFSNLFVIDQRSLELLYDRGQANVTVSGDMRFDAVSERAAHRVQDPVAESFCRDHAVLVAGSTWKPDEKLLARVLSAMPAGFRMILAPHEVDENRLREAERIFSGRTVRYSAWREDGPPGKTVLLVDNIGKLASLYRYGKYAYVGGAFGKGLHNILEAVVYGPPVFFGPGFHTFAEAEELVRKKTAFSVRSADRMKRVLSELEADPARYASIVETNRGYVAGQAGATHLVMNYLTLNHPDPGAKAG